MTGFTIRTAGDGKTHSAREQRVSVLPDQRVTVQLLGADMAGSSTGLGTGLLLVGLYGVDLPLDLPGSTSAPSAITYHHSDPSQVQWNDLGKVLVLSVVWSPDDYEP